MTTRLFDLAQKTGGVDRAWPRHPVELLLLLPVERVQEGPVLQRELPELRRQRVLKRAAMLHAGNGHREVHLTTKLRNVSLEVSEILELSNVWVFVQLIHRQSKTKNQLYKNPNIS